VSDDPAARERVVSLLAAMDRHRGLHLGPGPAKFSAMCGFIAGFMSARAASDLAWDTFDPPGFREFVIARVGGDYGEAMGWREILLSTAPSEDAALTSYFRMLSDFTVVDDSERRAWQERRKGV
jgi:hypothetical protein